MPGVRCTVFHNIERGGHKLIVVIKQGLLFSSRQCIPIILHRPQCRVQRFEKAAMKSISQKVRNQFPKIGNSLHTKCAAEVAKSSANPRKSAKVRVIFLWHVNC